MIKKGLLQKEQLVCHRLYTWGNGFGIAAVSVTASRFNLFELARRRTSAVPDQGGSARFYLVGFCRRFGRRELVGPRPWPVSSAFKEVRPHAARVNRGKRDPNRFIPRRRAWYLKAKLVQPRLSRYGK